MIKFKAVVKDKKTKEVVFIESEYNRKSDFISDLKGNGYAVNPNKVKTAEVFNFIMNNTNCEEIEWKYINRIPNENETVSDIVWAGLNKTSEKRNDNFEKKYGYRI